MIGDFILTLLIDFCFGIGVFIFFSTNERNVLIFNVLSNSSLDLNRFHNSVNWAQSDPIMGLFPNSH